MEHPAICQYCHWIGTEGSPGFASRVNNAMFPLIRVNSVAGGSLRRGSPWMVLGTLAEDTAGDGPN